jgi:hypothetical protein
VADATRALAAARDLTDDPEKLREMGARAEAFVAAHRGALKRLLAWIEPRIDPHPTPLPGPSEL